MKASKLNQATKLARQTVAIATPMGEDNWTTMEEFAHILGDYEKGVEALEGSLLTRTVAWVTFTYGTVMPSFETAREDRKGIALACLALGIGKAYATRRFNEALTAVFGALPASTEPEAMRKAAKRAADKLAEANKPPKVDTPPVDRQVSESEAIDQFIARVGFDLILARMAVILKEEKSTIPAAALCMDTIRAIHANDKPAKA